MDIQRAKAIAEALSPVRAFTIDHTACGLSIHYRGSHAYFVREHHFWPFVFKLAQLNNETGHIAEIEAELAA